MRSSRKIIGQLAVGLLLTAGTPAAVYATGPTTTAATAPTAVHTPASHVATAVATHTTPVTPTAATHVATEAPVHVATVATVHVAAVPTVHVAVAPAPTVHIETPPTATVHVTPTGVAGSHPVAIPVYVAPAPGADRAGLIAASKMLLARQAARTEQLLPASGYATVEEVGQKVAAMGPERAAVVDLLKAENKFEFTMRTPNQIRDSIASRGFLNQHDVKQSRGTLDPATRARVEASFLGISTTEYDQLPNSVRPKYGYLRPTKESGVTMNDGATQYGDDIFVFKHEAVKDHLTVYPEDSLGYSAAGWPARDGATPSQWHHAMLPWADRMLLAPGLKVPAGTHEVKFAAEPPPGFTGLSKRWGDHYLEIQIWRPLGIEDVERFEFAGAPPQGEFLKALRQNNVKIFKIGVIDEWKGDTAPPTAPTTMLFPRRSTAFAFAIAA